MTTRRSVRRRVKIQFLGFVLDSVAQCCSGTLLGPAVGAGLSPGVQKTQKRAMGNGPLLGVGGLGLLVPRCFSNGTGIFGEALENGIHLVLCHGAARRLIPEFRRTAQIRHEVVARQ